jgi:hypothetical protein
MRESRVQDANEPYIYKHGSKWLGDFRKSPFAHRRNNSVSYWLDNAGNRSTRWNSRQTRTNEYIRHIGIDLHDFIGAPRYQRRQGRILRCEHEIKEVSANCVIIKRTNTIWKLPNASGRYSQVTNSMVTTAMTTDPSVIEEQIFALLITGPIKPDSYVAVENPRNLQQQSLYLGLEMDLSNSNAISKRATKTTPATFDAVLEARNGETNGRVMIKELRGSSAKLWSNENVTESEVSIILSPQASATYTLPDSVKRKKIQWHKSEETLICGNLEFSKMNTKPPLVSGDSLYDVYRNDGINIVVSIPEKCSITFPRDGQLVSNEIDSGVFAVRSLLQTDESVYEQRLATLTIMESYRIEFDLNRYDFLTVVDIDNNILTTDDGSLGRIGSIETIDGQSTSESDSLLDRVG